MQRRFPAAVAVNEWTTTGADTVLEALSGAESTYADSWAAPTVLSQHLEVSFDDEQIARHFSTHVDAEYVAAELVVSLPAAGSATLQIELLTDNATDTYTLGTVVVTATSPTAASVTFAVRETASHTAALWTETELAEARLRLTQTAGTQFVRVHRASLLVKPRLTANRVVERIVDALPTTFGFTQQGATPATVTANGVLQMADASGANGVRYRRLEEVSPDYGEMSVTFRVPTTWTTFSGVFGVNIATVNTTSRFIQVNLVNASGQRQVGLLFGQPSSFDPTLVASYADLTPLAWEGRFVTLVLRWTPTRVTVHASDDASTDALVIDFDITLIGPGVSGRFVEFGTESAASTGLASQGTIEIVKLGFSGRHAAAVGANAAIDYVSSHILTSSDFSPELAIVWRPTVNINAYRVRYRGTAYNTGFYIGVNSLSQNTESDSPVAANTQVVTTVAAEDIFSLEPDSSDGTGPVAIFVQDSLLLQYATLAVSPQTDIEFHKSIPAIVAPDYVHGYTPLAFLQANRQFRVEAPTVPPAGLERHTAQLQFDGQTAVAESDTEYLFLNLPFDDEPYNVLFQPNSVVALEGEGIASFSVQVYDEFGHSELVQIQMFVREATAFETTRGDAEFRFGLPEGTRYKDPSLTANYLPPFDAVLYQLREIAKKQANLVDIDKAPHDPGEETDALHWMFWEMGLVYPSIPGYSELGLRRLLKNADQIHRTRYTLNGLRFYLNLLIPNVDVEIEGAAPQGLFIFLNSPQFGFPNLDTLATIGSGNDVNTYLPGPHILGDITVTITGTVSAEMQEFIDSTIRNELIMVDDPIDPRTVNVVYVP